MKIWLVDFQFSITHLTTRYNQLAIRQVQVILVNPCTYPFGAVMGGIDCNKVNPLIWYSGDPVGRELGWLNITWADKLFFLNTGSLHT